MTLLLFTWHGAPVGRHELPDTNARPPMVVTWRGRAFVWQETQPMGWQTYAEVEPYAIADDAVREAPKPPPSEAR